MGIRNVFTSAYHPQTNGQAERYNRTLLAGLRRYVAEDLRDWDKFCHAITYAYNSHVHRATGLAPFELVLSRPPAHLAVENTESIDTEKLSTAQHRTRFLQRIASLMRTASERIKQAQSRYKANFDAHVRVRNQDLQPGDYVFIRRELPIEGETNKLQSPSIGPFKVVKKSSHTVVIIDEDGLEDTISLDRVTRAPGMSTRVEEPEEELPPQEDAEQEQSGIQPDAPQDDTASAPEAPMQEQTLPSPTVNDGRGMVTRARARAEQQATQQDTPVASDDPGEQGRELLTEDEGYDHGFDRILRYDLAGNQFKVRWTGYGPQDDTWVNPEDLPPNAIVRFFRRRRTPIPDSVRDRLPPYLADINIIDDVWL